MWEGHETVREAVSEFGRYLPFIREKRGCQSCGYRLPCRHLSEDGRARNPAGIRVHGAGGR
jgi:hypothetical protein